MTGIMTKESLLKAGFYEIDNSYIKDYQGGEHEQVMKTEVGIEIPLFPFDMKEIEDGDTYYGDNDEYDVYDLQDSIGCPLSSTWFASTND